MLDDFFTASALTLVAAIAAIAACTHFSDPSVVEPTPMEPIVFGADADVPAVAPPTAAPIALVTLPTVVVVGRREAPLETRSVAAAD